jgi:hypothetical protein
MAEKGELKMENRERREAQVAENGSVKLEKREKRRAFLALPSRVDVPSDRKQQIPRCARDDRWWFGRVSDARVRLRSRLEIIAGLCFVWVGHGF